MGYAGQIETSGGAISPIGSTLYGVCSTAAATAAKVVTLADYDELITGTTVHVKFLNGNTAESITLEVGGTAAKPVYQYGTTAPGSTAATSWAANSMISFTYDGTAWRMNDAGANAAMITLLEGEVSSEASARATAVTSLATQIAAQYSTASTYKLYDLCIQNNSLYRCTTAITTPEAWTPAHWTAAKVSTEVGKKLKFENISAGGSPTATASVSGTGITAATVNAATFATQIPTSGTYVFSYNGASWVYGGSTVTLSTYGIEVTGTAANGDTVTVSLTVPTIQFVPDPDATYTDFPYRATVPLTGVTATMIPTVVYDAPEAISGTYAPIAKSFDGGVYLWAAEAIATAINIPTIFCWE